VNGPVGLILAAAIIKEQEFVQPADAIAQTATHEPIDRQIGRIQVTGIVV
jgi:hypothetical protein